MLIIMYNDNSYILV